MVREGLKISPKDSAQDIINDLEEAIRHESFHFIYKRDRVIGWVATFKNGNKVYITHCFIYKACRDRSNLLYLRSYLRGLYKGMKFYFHSNRRDRYFKER